EGAQEARREQDGQDAHREQEDIEKDGQIVADDGVGKRRTVLPPEGQACHDGTDQADQREGCQPVPSPDRDDEVESEHDDGGNDDDDLGQDDAVVDAETVEVDRQRTTTGNARTVASTAAGKKFGLIPITTIRASSGARTPVSIHRSSPKPVGSTGTS